MFQVTSLLGDVLGTYKLNATSHDEYLDINLSNVAPGFYLGSILLGEGKGSSSNKIIITK